MSRGLSEDPTVLMQMLDSISDMSKDFITAAEHLHREFNSPNPKTDPSSIGNILIEMGTITANELMEHVRSFKLSSHNGERLGEYLVRESCLTMEQLEIALDKQKRMRSGQ